MKEQALASGTTKRRAAATSLLAIVVALAACSANGASDEDATGRAAQASTLGSGTLYAGMNVSANTSQEVNDVRSLGVSAVRINNAYATKSIVQSYHNAGMKVLIVLDGNLHSGTDPSGFAQAAGAVANDYKVNWGNAVDAYEVWNEEDNGSLSPTQYAQLLAATCTQIKRVTNFGVKVVMGGLYKSDPTYLSSVIANMNNYGSCVDAVAFHLYENWAGCGTGTCYNFSGGNLNLKTLAQRMIAVSQGKPVMLTEWGTTGSTNESCLRSNIQDFFQNALTGTGLDSAFYFKWRSTGDFDSACNNTSLSEEVSLVNSDYSHKLSWGVWQQFHHN